MKVVSNSSENCVKNMSKLSQDMKFGRYFCLCGPNDPRFNFFVAFFEEKKLVLQVGNEIFFIAST